MSNIGISIPFLGVQGPPGPNGSPGPPGGVVATVVSLAALAALSTTGFTAGTLTYVAGTNKIYFGYDPTSVATPNGSTIIAAQGGGNWILFQGSSQAPLRVTAAGTTLTNTQTLIYASTASAAYTITLPPTPIDGQAHTFFDDHYTWDARNLTVAANSGQTIMDMTRLPGTFGSSTLLTVRGALIAFAYDNAQSRWNPA